MRLALGLVLLTALLSGCSWDPIRDNPVDPHSPYYEPPPPHNRPPHVDTLFVTTDCLFNSFEHRCGFTATCRITDPDNNILHDSVFFWIGSDLMGPMIYLPGSGEWQLTRQQHDLGGSLEQFVGRAAWVIARDDSAAADTLFSIFPALFLQWPIVSYPRGNILAPAVLETLHPRLGWLTTSGGSDTSKTWDVSVLLSGEILAWDTTHLAKDDSVVVVSEELRNSRDSGDIYYTWVLTVVDSRGSRASAEPQYFQCAPPDTAVMRDPEPGRERSIWE